MVVNFLQDAPGIQFFPGALSSGGETNSAAHGMLEGSACLRTNNKGLDGPRQVFLPVHSSREVGLNTKTTRAIKEKHVPKVSRERKCVRINDKKQQNVRC